LFLRNSVTASFSLDYQPYGPSYGQAGSEEAMYKGRMLVP
jgi:hypothetical protein